MSGWEAVEGEYMIRRWEKSLDKTRAQIAEGARPTGREQALGWSANWRRNPERQWSLIGSELCPKAVGNT